MALQDHVSVERRLTALLTDYCIENPDINVQPPERLSHSTVAKLASAYVPSFLPYTALSHPNDYPTTTVAPTVLPAFPVLGSEQYSTSANNSNFPPPHLPEQTWRQPQTPSRRASITPVSPTTGMTKNSSRISSPTSSHTVRQSPHSTTAADRPATTTSDPTQTAKPKRVRTGCLTCRERHLKCDEGLPTCQNCKKSSRKCKRGVRLNFIDTTCERPPVIVPPSHDWRVTFQDESRDIASEFKGGLEKYHPFEPEPKRQRLDMAEMNYDYAQLTGAVIPHHQPLQQQIPQPTMQQTPTYQTYSEPTTAMYSHSTTYQDPTAAMTAYQDQPAIRQSYEPNMLVQPQADAAANPYLEDREEILYMQVFVEEVGVWMDSMDADKHFSRIIPFEALRQPMLKHALLSCGVRHLTLVNSAYPEEHALHYYNSATQLLLKALTNPNRDSFLCATTATILNVYEVMSESALQRMNHIAGARALIKECRWNANTTGIGGACFWLNVGLEIFSCLHFDWGVAWDPDDWGIDMAMSPQSTAGNEELWTHKILWILAQVTNFKSTKPRFQEQTLHAEQMRMSNRHNKWLGLKQFCERWDQCVPPTMHALAYVPTYTPGGKSTFPAVWYIKRTTIVARLFYHTAMALLAASHPMDQVSQHVADEMQDTRLLHSRMICGIVAHVKDRGVASASIRCLAVAGENLTNRREQEEVLQIFDKIKKETGWRVKFIHDDLRAKWGWASEAYDMNGQQAFYQQGTPQVAAPTPRSRPPSGIVNPMYKNADFSAQNPPYQGSYVPPSQHLSHATNMFGFASISNM